MLRICHFHTTHISAPVSAALNLHLFELLLKFPSIASHYLFQESHKLKFKGARESASKTREISHYLPICNIRVWCGSRKWAMDVKPACSWSQWPPAYWNQVGNVGKWFDRPQIDWTFICCNLAGILMHYFNYPGRTCSWTQCRREAGLGIQIASKRFLLFPFLKPPLLKVPFEEAIFFKFFKGTGAHPDPISEHVRVCSALRVQRSLHQFSCCNGSEEEGGSLSWHLHLVQSTALSMPKSSQSTANSLMSFWLHCFLFITSLCCNSNSSSAPHASYWHIFSKRGHSLK